MKKVLLTLAVLAASSVAGYADVATLNFGEGKEIPGLGAPLTAAPTKDQCSYNLSFTMDDVNVALTNDLVMQDSNGADKQSTGFGMGYVYNVQNKPIQSGIWISSSVNTKLTVSIPGAKITGIKLVLSGYALSALDINFGDKAVSGEALGGGPYEWTWSDSASEQDAVSMSWVSTFMARYINSVEITYTPDLGGKQVCGLSFASETAQGFMGESFEAPALNNPNNLPVTWSSSNENVATVNEQGVVTLVSAGNATITAATEGNDEYAKGSARYTVTVMGVAKNIAELLQYAPANGDLAKVTFPVTVYYGSGSGAYVVDAENNAAYFFDTAKAEGDVAAVGQVIPGGWVATNTSANETVFSGVFPAVTETVEVVYPEVTAVTKADANRVVVFPGAKLNKDIVGSLDEKYTFTSAAGDTYSCENTFNAQAYAAGRYNITCVVKLGKVGTREIFWLAPIAFEKVEEVVTAPAPADLKVAISGEEGSIEFDEENEAFVGTTTVAEENAEVTLTVPEDFDNFIYMEQLMGEGQLRAAADDEEESPWTPVAEMKEGGFTLGNVITVPADGAMHVYGAYLVKGDNAYMPASYVFMITATKAGGETPEAKAVTFDFVTEDYGLTRQTLATAPTNMYGNPINDITFQLPVVVEKDGVKVSFGNNAELTTIEGADPKGFALWDCTGNAVYTGLGSCAVFMNKDGNTYQKVNTTIPEMTITAGGQKITKITYVVTGSGMSSATDMKVNGVTLSEPEGTATVTGLTYVWTSEEGVEEAVLTFAGAQNYTRVCRSLQIEYLEEAVEPTYETYTFDFTTADPYGYTANYSQYFSTDEVIASAEGVDLSAKTPKNIRYMKAAPGLQVAKGSVFGVSTNGRAIKSVSVVTMQPTTTYEVAIDGSTATISLTASGFVQKVEVEYESDGLESAGISYPAATLTLINGADEIKGLVLENPNEVPVTYTSSSEQVIVNAEGEISLAEGANAVEATITATFAGNDTYRAAEASYSVTVIGSAKTIAELKSLTTVNKAQAYVTFPTVVAYSNGNFAFLQSVDGKESLEISQSLIGETYATNDVIPGGWLATATVSNGASVYAMGEKPESTETQEPTIVKVTELTLDEVTKVVVLKNVEISEAVWEKMPDGTGGAGAGFDVTVGEATYNVYNQFKLNKPEAAGKYDLKCAVVLYEKAPRIWPIEYLEPVSYPIEESCTFDFTTEEPYGYTKNYSFAKNNVIATEGDFTLKAGSSCRYVKGSGMEINSRGGQFIITSAGMPIQNVTYTCSVEDPDIEVKKVSDFEYTITNFGMDKYILPTITVDYLNDGLENSGISFPAATLKLVNGLDEIKGLELTNPNEVPVTYSSSSDEVVVNAETGAISLAEGANAVTATITATFAGNDKYRAADASYTLTIYGKATSLAELKTLAAESGVQAYVDFPSVVAYANGSFAFIQSLDGTESAEIMGNGVVGDTYKTNDVIPAGWLATATLAQGFVRYAMPTEKPESTETKEPVIEEVTSLTEADVTKVVVLKDVELSEEVWTKMPDGTTGSGISGFDVTAGGVTYNFYNQFKLAKPAAAGTYDAKVAVLLYNGAIRLYPIEYIVKPEELLRPDITDIKVTVSGESTIDADADDDTWYITTTVLEDNAEVTLEVPAGFTDFLAVGYHFEGDQSPTVLRAGTPLDPESWAPVSQLKEAYDASLGHEFSIPADGQNHVIMLYLVKDEMVYAAEGYTLSVTANKSVELARPDVADLKVEATGKFTVEVDAEEETINVTSKVENETEVTVTIAVPEGFDNFMYMAMGGDISTGTYQLRASALDPEAWMPVTVLQEQGLTLGNEIKVDADGKTYMYGLYLVKGEEVYAAEPYYLSVTASSESTGVDAIEAVEDDAEYYTLQGLKVVNPAAGMYVKVKDGKVTKVVIR